MLIELADPWVWKSTWMTHVDILTAMTYIWMETIFFLLLEFGLFHLPFPLLKQTAIRCFWTQIWRTVESQRSANLVLTQHFNSQLTDILHVGRQNLLKSVDFYLLSSLPFLSQGFVLVASPGSFQSLKTGHWFVFLIISFFSVQCH